MSFEQKIAPEKARQEIDAWLDFKKIMPAKRAANEDAISTLVDKLVYGDLEIDDNKNITYTLNFPLGGGEGELSVNTLTFKPRLTTRDVSEKTKNVKPTDLEGRITAYVSALTGKSAGILSKLDTTDEDVCRSVAVFFM